MSVPIFALVVMVTLAATPALAAPGDRFEIHGTVVWPTQLVDEPFLVVRGDDGRVYSTDVSSARSAVAPVRAGDRVAVLAVEGELPYAMIATAVVPEAATQPGADIQPSASPPSVADRVMPAPIPPQTPLPSPAQRPPAPEVHRLDGTIADISAGQMKLRMSDGRRVRVDLNRVRGAVSDSLRAGEPVTVFAERGEEDAFVAIGLVYPSAAR